MPRGYVTGLGSAGLSQSVVDNMISAALSGYVTKSYVDTQDALNATKAFIDAGDAGVLKLSQKGAPNGVAPLDSQSRIPIAYVPASSTQRFPKSPTSPTSYGGAVTLTTSTETLLFPVTVADPGFAYRLMVMGGLDSSTSVVGEYPIFRVRQSGLTGQVMAGGYGMKEVWVPGQVTSYNLHGTYSYSIPSWADTIDIIVLGAGGGGGGGDTGFGVAGQGGGAGGFGSISLARGTGFLAASNSMTVVIGAAGTAGAAAAPGTAGGASTVQYTNSSSVTTTLTGAAGAAGPQANSGGGSGNPGGSPGSRTLNNHTLTGGATAAQGLPGNAPGGGGGGGAGGFFGNGSGGMPGSDGAALIFAGVISPPRGTTNIIPVPLNAQTTMTGAQTFYVTAQRVGSTSTQTIPMSQPRIWVMAVPA